MKPSIFILALCVSLLACKKDSGSSTSNTQQITSADWKYDTGGVSDANGNIIIPFTSATVPDCLTDNTIHFNSNGTGTVAENANVCPGAPGTSTFNWSFSNSETVLNVSAGAIAGIGGSFKIKTLTSTQFTLLKDTTVSGVATTVAVKLKH